MVNAGAPSGRIRRGEASALTLAPGDTEKSTRKRGRPRELVTITRCWAYLDQRHVDLIASYQAQHGGSFSSALRAILDAFDEMTRVNG